MWSFFDSLFRFKKSAMLAPEVIVVGTDIINITADIPPNTPLRFVYLEAFAIFPFFSYFSDLT